MCTLCENFGVVEGTSRGGHMRWAPGENWKSSHVHLAWELWVWWRGHLVMPDGHEVRFEKSSRMHLVWELWCGGGDISWGTHEMGTRWELKVISCPPCVRTLVWWRGHLVTLDGHEVRFEKSSRVHLAWELCYWYEPPSEILHSLILGISVFLKGTKWLCLWKLCRSSIWLFFLHFFTHFHQDLCYCNNSRVFSNKGNLVWLEKLDELNKVTHARITIY